MGVMTPVYRYNLGLNIAAAGLGEVVAGAAVYWGLRAYATADRGTAAIRVRRSSDNAEQDINTLASNGDLDLASAASFAGGSNLFLTTIYDQTVAGSGSTPLNPTQAQQAALTFAGVGQRPVMTFSGGQSLNLNPYPTTVTLGSPFTLCVVGETGASFTDGTFLYTNNNYSIATTVAGNVRAYDVNINLDIAAAVNTWYAMVGVFNGASSIFNVNGSTTTGTFGTGVVNPSYTQIGVAASSLRYLTGAVAEVCFWDFALNADQQADVIANQRNYWGF